MTEDKYKIEIFEEILSKEHLDGDITQILEGLLARPEKRAPGREELERFLKIKSFFEEGVKISDDKEINDFLEFLEKQYKERRRPLDKIIRVFSIYQELTTRPMIEEERNALMDDLSKIKVLEYKSINKERIKVILKWIKDRLRDKDLDESKRRFLEYCKFSCERKIRKEKVQRDRRKKFSKEENKKRSKALKRMVKKQKKK